MPQIIARQLFWKRAVYQCAFLMVLRMFSLLKTCKQLSFMWSKPLSWLFFLTWSQLWGVLEQRLLIRWRRTWQPTPVFLPGESCGQRSLVGCLLWGRTESDRLKRLSSSSSCCLSEVFKFCRWAQEKDNAYLKLKVFVRAESGPTLLLP